MNTSKINPRFLILAGLILLAAFMRVANIGFLNNTFLTQFSPLAALSLFAGTYFTKSWKALAFVIAIMFVSDIFIQQVIYKGQYGFLYSGWYWIYGIFALITLFGKWIIKRVTVTNVLIASITAVISHWLIMDFTVWISGGIDIRTKLPLTKDWEGLVQSYVQGIPFMLNLLKGTLLYGGIMFGSFEWMQTKYKSLQLQYA